MQVLFNNLFQVDDHLLPEPFQVLAGDQLVRMDPGRGCRRLVLLLRFSMLPPYHSLKTIMENPNRWVVNHIKITPPLVESREISPSDFEKIENY